MCWNRKLSSYNAKSCHPTNSYDCFRFHLRLCPQGRNINLFGYNESLLDSKHTWQTMMMINMFLLLMRIRAEGQRIGTKRRGQNSSNLSLD